MGPEAPASAMPWGRIGKPLLRLVVCIVAVFVVTAALYAIPLRDRSLAAALTYLFLVIAAALWGFRYALCVSFLTALGFSWLLPPVGRFWLSDPRDVLALAVFLFIAITTSRISDRARKEAVNANQRRTEAVAAQQRFADLVNSVEGIVWEANAEPFVFTFVSEQAERVLGYPTKRWLEEPTFWKEHIHPDDRGGVVQFCLHPAAEKRSHDFEYRMIAADGRVVWLRDLVTIVVENGRATQLRGVMIDVTKRKQNEERLREQANLLSLTHDAVFVRDMSAAIQYWNRAAEEMYGWTVDEASGKVSHRLLQTVFPVQLEQIEAELMRTGRWEGELAHTRKDGTPIVVASRWSLQQDNQGIPIAILETNNDITDQKDAEQSRQEIEEQWKAAFESNPTMYFIVDAAGAIVSVNAFGADQLGYTVSELVGQPVLNVFYEPDREPVQNHANSCFQQPDRTRRWEARKIRKDGRMIWVRETAQAVFLKKRPVLLVVCEDITERKRAEQALQRSESYLTEAQRLTHTGSWAFNPATEKNNYWSEEMFRIFALDSQHGLPTSETFWDRVHPEDRDSVHQVFQQAAREKTEYEHDHRILLPDGTVKHIHALGHPLFNAAGDLVEFVGTSIDVTERKRAEQERERLQQLQAELARMNRVTTMGELTASLAHEINQPIAAAVTNASTGLRWLAIDPPNIEEAREAAKRSVKDANRAAEIIGRIRQLFRKGTAERELLDINEVIREMIVLLLNEAHRYSISLRMDLDTDLPSIVADRVQLQQVLMNLMLNGIDAVKDADGERELTIKSGRQNRDLLISVTDTGKGLPANEAEKIFDAFFTTKTDGTGMGLSISRSIIESHGGRLWAMNNTLHGATFYFTLPTNVEAQDDDARWRSYGVHY